MALLGIFPVGAFAQNVDLFLFPENVEILLGNNENVYMDPTLYDDVVDFPGITETNNRFGNSNDQEGVSKAESIFSSFDLDMEIGWSKTAKFFNIPISYYYKNFELSLKMPFYYQRQVYYSHGYVSTMGLGDLNLIGAWEHSNNNMFYNNLSVALSIPTGNENKNVDSYLCPLGSGSYDFILKDEFQYNRSSFSINAIATYRYSGESNRTVIINYSDFDGTQMMKYKLDNGHTFVLNSSANILITQYASIFGGFTIMNNYSGKLSNLQTYSWKPDVNYVESDGNYREFLIVDAKAAISATILSTDITFVVSYPIYTDFKQYSIVESRDYSYYIKLSRNIF